MYSDSATIPVPVVSSPAQLAMVLGSVRAGFPSPAEDFGIARFDLAKALVRHPATTFVMPLRGDSMINAGLYDGDLLVVDRVLHAVHDDIVVAELDCDFTCKRLYQRNGVFMLRPENPTYPDIRPREGQTIALWGVVTASVRRYRKW